MTPAEQTLAKILAEREAEQKAYLAERKLGLEYERSKRQIELELYTVKTSLYPENHGDAQKKLEIQLRLAILLETLNQLENLKAQ